MRKKIQFALFYLQTFISRHVKELFLSAISGFLISLIMIQTFPLFWEMMGQKYQKIGIVGIYSEDNLPRDIKNQISLGMTTLTDNGEAKPAAAKSWEIEKDGTVYIFHLNPDLKWHDGNKLQASDIRINFKGVTTEAIDSQTLKITLSEVYAPLPVLLSAPLFKNNLVGLGKYQVTRLKKSEGKIDEITMESKDDKSVTLIYKFYRNYADASLAFKLGEVNSLPELDDATKFDGWKNVFINPKTKFDRLVTVLFNLKQSVFKDKEVRQALAYAIPEIPDFEKAVSPISPLSWAYSKKIRLYNFDEETSRKIISKSSLAQSPELTLSTFSHLLKQAQFLADAWKNVGVKIKIRVVNSIPDDYQLLLTPLTIPADPDQYFYWQSTQEATNLTNYSNPKIDKLLEDGRKTVDINLRTKIYADFQLYLIDDAPAIFLYYPKVYTVERK